MTGASGGNDRYVGIGDTATVPENDGGDRFFHGDRSPSVLICAQGDEGAVSAPQLARYAKALGHRVLGSVAIDLAKARLASLVTVDAVILSCTGLEPEVDSLMAALRETWRTHGARAIVIASLAGLDRVHALLDVPGAILLCEPQPDELLAALATLASAGHQPGVHGLGDGANEGRDPLDVVTGQLERLSRMIESLVGHRHSTALTMQPNTNAVLPPVSSFHGGAVAMDSEAFGVSGAQVRALLRARRLRERLFAADLFADPAWDMLLDLFAARLERVQVSVSSLCIAAAVPPTTALRWIRHLTDRELIQREADPEDGRRVFVALSGKGMEAMMRWLRESRAHFAAAAGAGAGSVTPPPTP